MEQIGVALDFFAFYTAGKLGVTGLNVSCTVRDRAGTVLANAQTATEIGGGLYRYTLAAGSNTVEGECIAVFTTATTTVDQRDIPALWVVSKGGIENLDAAVTTRLATVGYTAPDNAGITSLGTDLTTLLGRLSAARALLLDNLASLDAAVSSRLAAADYSATDLSSIVTTLDGIVTSLADAAVTVVSPVSVDGGTVTLIQGDTYDLDEARALEWSSTAWPTLTGATVSLRVYVSRTVQTYACTVVDADTVRLELTATQTTALPDGRYQYRLVATLTDGHIQTLAQGMLVVEPAR